MRTITATLMAFSLGSLVPDPCLAQNQQPNAPWYLGLRGGVSEQDASNETDQGRVVSVLLGRHRHATSSWEVELWQDEHAFSGGRDLEQLGVGFNWLQVNREPLWNPYFLMGLGALQTDLDAQSSTDVSISVAIGGSWDLGETGLQMTADLRYRYTILDDGLDDQIDRGEPQLMIGVQLPLWFGVR